MRWGCDHVSVEKGEVGGDCFQFKVHFGSGLWDRPFFRGARRGLTRVFVNCPISSQAMPVKHPTKHTADLDAKSDDMTKVCMSVAMMRKPHRKATPASSQAQALNFNAKISLTQPKHPFPMVMSNVALLITSDQQFLSDVRRQFNRVIHSTKHRI